VWTSTEVVDVLRRRGEIWEPLPGLASLRGDALSLLRVIESRIAALAEPEGCPEWRLAPGLSLGTLSRAHYFESFPQWLTAAGHLSGDPKVLESVARAEDPAGAAADALEPAECALSPALCYHTYERLAGSTVDSVQMTAQGTCWRHEGDRLRTLERGWAFTMRELVHVGDSGETERFRRRGMRRATALASELGLESTIVTATDPFFAPTARGKELLQMMKGLKHELMLPLGDGESIAAASFNNHERFFGETFDIRLPGGQPAASGCVAFGVERWLLAFLVAHGPDSAGWPEVDINLSTVEATAP
jgi:seryl-tRNA synthetase